MNNPLLTCLSLALLLTGCGKDPAANSSPATSAQAHQHRAPHGGTAVELGEEAYHLELVLDAAQGKMQAFVLDGELEQFVRVRAESFEVLATLPSKQESLIFHAATTPATGEKVGDTALFEAQADWLKASPTFDGILKELTIRDTAYREVPFNFPKGNDEKEKR
jgi:hypothetical protein